MYKRNKQNVFSDYEKRERNMEQTEGDLVEQAARLNMREKFIASE